MYNRRRHGREIYLRERAGNKDRICNRDQVLDEEAGRRGYEGIRGAKSGGRSERKLPVGCVRDWGLGKWGRRGGRQLSRWGEDCRGVTDRGAIASVCSACVCRCVTCRDACRKTDGRNECAMRGRVRIAMRYSAAGCRKRAPPGHPGMPEYVGMMSECLAEIRWQGRRGGGGERRKRAVAIGNGATATFPLVTVCC